MDEFELNSGGAGGTAGQVGRFGGDDRGGVHLFERLLHATAAAAFPVIIAYINEEFPGRAGSVMAAYVAGTVFGGFLGRFLTGVIAARGNWHAAFLVLGGLDLLGALAVRQWLPLATHFVPGQHVLASLGDACRHLRNRRRLLICGMGFTVLLSLVGVFTYVNFFLARPPFHLSTAGLGSVFSVYVTCYYLGGSVGTTLPAWFWRNGGWPACVGLFAAISLVTLALGLAAGKSIAAGANTPSEIVDTAI